MPPHGPRQQHGPPERHGRTVRPHHRLYRRQHLRPLTIPEICEHFSLSRSALQLLFKNSVDQSPKKYINDKKLERSCQMLLENRYTISEISLRLGYSSIHYFSKSFNMKYHMSPSEFVKQNCQSSV